MKLWDYAVGVWADAAVRSLCLELQTAHQQCVPLILWRLWTITERRALNCGAIEQAAAVCRDWESLVTTPLRSVSHRMKGGVPPILQTAAPAVRELLEATILAAERALLEALEAMTTAPSDGVRDSLSTLERLTTVWGRPAPESLLAPLLAAACRGRS